MEASLHSKWIRDNHNWIQSKDGKKKPFDFQSREDMVRSKTNWHLKFQHWGSETIQFMGRC